MTEGAFRFRVEGQPVSWNAAFRVTSGRGRAQISKTADAELWQQTVANACEKAKPRGWVQTTKQLRIRYWLHLNRLMDADNTLKLINDGVAHGLGLKVVKMKLVPVINDNCFLPEVVELTTGNKEPHVIVEVAPHED